MKHIVGNFINFVDGIKYETENEYLEKNKVDKNKKIKK